MDKSSRIAVFGASGLIGSAVTSSLLAEGFSVVAIARRLTPAQRNSYGEAIECPITELGAAGLERILAAHNVDVVVNCLGALQGTPEATDRIDQQFVSALVAAMGSVCPDGTLIHLSIPGNDGDDRTNFSRSKRSVESYIASAALSYAILRPGFVIAPNAYGGSALLRALAALPVALPAKLVTHPFAATAMDEVCKTIAFVVKRCASGQRFASTWDVMENRAHTVGDVIEQFRRRFGGPDGRFVLPSWLLTLGAAAGDVAGVLGWSPPVRTTALTELRRGVKGDPSSWIAATAIEPKSMEEAVNGLPATIQEEWFGRLFLLKAVIMVVLSAFWIVSGLIALTVAFEAATTILVGAGFPVPAARALTVASSLIDIAVGLGIAFRKTARVSLIAGIVVSVGYMASAAPLFPQLWAEPLGALVKTGPAIILMLVALAIRQAR